MYDIIASNLGIGRRLMKNINKKMEEMMKVGAESEEIYLGKYYCSVEANHILNDMDDLSNRNWWEDYFNIRSRLWLEF